MPRPPMITGEIRNWRWLDNDQRISGQMFDDKLSLLADGSNVLFTVKYKSHYHTFVNRPYWLIMSVYMETDQRYIMYCDQERK